MKYKNIYFKEIGYKDPWSAKVFDNKWDKNRRKKWHNQRKKQGKFDSRCAWNLNTFIAESIYTWLNIYKDDASQFVKLDFYEFEISLDGKTTEKKTEIDWINDCLAYMKEYLLSVDTFDCEKEKNGINCMKKAFIILSEIFPTLWW